MTHLTKRIVFITGNVLLSVSWMLLTLVPQSAFAASDCETNTSESTVPATCEQLPLSETPAAAPIFVDATCTTSGYYVIPEATAQFVVDESAEPILPGTYNVAPGTQVNITELLGGSASEDTNVTPKTWSHIFQAASCPEVLGASTSDPDTPSVLVAETLKNTGVSPFITTIAALALVSTAGFIYAQPAQSDQRKK